MTLSSAGGFPIKGYDSEVVFGRPSWGARVGVVVLSYARGMDAQLKEELVGVRGFPSHPASCHDYCK